MDDWREKLERGDVSKAAKRAGCHVNKYSESLKLHPSEWTAAMVSINREVETIVTERETYRAAKIEEERIKEERRLLESLKHQEAC